MDLDNKLFDLRKRILNLLDQKEILSTNDSLNFYDLNRAVNKEFTIYSKYFDKMVNTSATELNFESYFKNILGIKTPFISKIVPSVINMIPMVTIYFCDNNDFYVGQMIITEENETPVLKDFDEKYLNKGSNEFFNNCYNEYHKMLFVLKSFKNEFETDFSWDLENPCENSILEVSDGFLRGRINLASKDTAKLSLSNKEDLYISSLKSRKYGELFDYIDFYNEAIQKRFLVNIDDLNPLFKKIIMKHYNLGNEKKLMMTNTNK